MSDAPLSVSPCASGYDRPGPQSAAWRAGVHSACLVAAGSRRHAAGPASPANAADKGERDRAPPESEPPSDDNGPQVINGRLQLTSISLGRRARVASIPGRGVWFSQQTFLGRDSVDRLPDCCRWDCRGSAMKKIGLVGGISWVSTLDYYRYINEGINERLGGLEFAECIIYSVNFNDVQRHGWDNWDETFLLLSAACTHLKAAGAEAIVLCANTAHAIADELEAHIQLPLIHIATATATEVSRYGLRKVGLLGTKFTMELPFYRDKLRLQNIEALVPQEQRVRDFIQQTLKEELGRGIVSPATKAAYIEVTNQLIACGAEGIVLACTEIPLLLSQQDVAVPVFDTTRIHVQAAVEFALSGHAGT
jgi:aspartate racemase